MLCARAWLTTTGKPKGERQMAQQSVAQSELPLSEDMLAKLRQKYEEERQKRLRPDGENQYTPLTGRFADLSTDPHGDPALKRTSFRGHTHVLVIGGGFSGLSVSARMRLAGIEDFRIIEAGSDFGGTWYWNRYPGAQCDTESYIYLPLLEETGYVPSEKYAHWNEIYAHAQRIGRQFDLYSRAFFQTRVEDLRWLEAKKVWQIKTNLGDEFTARFVVKTNGVLDRPKLPGIPGIEQFEGHIFHTSRWDFDYTGGDSFGNLFKLADKRVAVVGTGATSVQVVPHVAKDAKHLYVVQRTPSSISRRANHPTSPKLFEGLHPGWQQRRRENFVSLTSGVPQSEDLVADAWTESVRKLGGMFANADENLSPEEAARNAEIADFLYMEKVRERIDTTVHDPATANALKPWYRFFCKRPCLSDEYLPTFNRSNVTLLDTGGAGAESIGPRSIRVAGQDYEVDCIIFATGFELGTDPTHHSGFEVYGRDQRKLSEEWATSLNSLYGCTTFGFPNLFHMGLGQNGVSYVFTYNGDEQAKNIAEILKRAQVGEFTYVEAELEAQTAWRDVIDSKNSAAIAFQRQCTPGLYNSEGVRTDKRGIAEEAYGGGPIEFYQIVRDWHGQGMPGLNFGKD